MGCAGGDDAWMGKASVFDLLRNTELPIKKPSRPSVLPAVNGAPVKEKKVKKEKKEKKEKKDKKKKVGIYLYAYIVMEYICMSIS